MYRILDVFSHLDRQCIILLNRKLHTPLLDRLVPIVTHCGGATFTITLCLIIMYMNKSNGAKFLLTLTVSHIIVQLFKYFLPRLRPYMKLPDLRLFPKALSDSSFPSGHSAAAFSVAASLSMIYPPYATISYLLASVIGYTRIYLGLHYPTDVCFGASIGIITSLIIWGGF